MRGCYLVHRRGYLRSNWKGGPPGNDGPPSATLQSAGRLSTTLRSAREGSVLAGCAYRWATGRLAAIRGTGRACVRAGVPALTIVRGQLHVVRAEVGEARSSLLSCRSHAVGRGSCSRRREKGSAGEDAGNGQSCHQLPGVHRSQTRGQGIPPCVWIARRRARWRLPAWNTLYYARLTGAAYFPGLGIVKLHSNEPREVASRPRVLRFWASFGRRRYFPLRSARRSGPAPLGRERERPWSRRLLNDPRASPTARVPPPKGQAQISRAPLTASSVARAASSPPSRCPRDFVSNGDTAAFLLSRPPSGRWQRRRRRRGILTCPPRYCG